MKKLLIAGSIVSMFALTSSVAFADTTQQQAQNRMQMKQSRKDNLLDSSLKPKPVVVQEAKQVEQPKQMEKKEMKKAIKKGVKKAAKKASAPTTAQ